MVTTHESLDYLLDAIKSGAAGYVLKEVTRGQLLSAVRWVLQGESPLNQELAMRLLQHLAEQNNEEKRPVSKPARGRQQDPLPGPLTDKEIEVLRLLTLGKTNRQLAQDLRVGISTVKTYVQRVFRKLEVSDRTQAAVRAVELGLLSSEREK